MEEKLPSWAVCAKNARTIRKNRIVRIDVNQPAIAKHIKNIFSSGELDKERVYSKMEYTATDGTLTALALLIAESNPNEKALVVNLTRKLLS